MEALDLALGFCVGLLVGGLAVWLALRSAARSKELAHAARMQEAREALEKSQRKLNAMSEARAADLRRMARAEAGEEEEPEEETVDEPVELIEEVEEPVVEIADEQAEVEPDDGEAEELRRELQEAHAELETLRREASLHEQELHELRAEVDRLGAALAESTRAFDVRDQDVEALLAANERWKSEVEDLRAALENARTESTLAMVSGVGQPNGDQVEELAQALAALEELEERAKASAAALAECEARVANLTSHAADQADRLKSCEETAPPPTTDDLTRIRGIGAVFARRLIGIGIASCSDLAEADPAAIREALDLVDVARVKIEDWVEDAKDLANDEA